METFSEAIFHTFIHFNLLLQFLLAYCHSYSQNTMVYEMLKKLNFIGLKLLSRDSKIYFPH